MRYYLHHVQYLWKGRLEVVKGREHVEVQYVPAVYIAILCRLPPKESWQLPIIQISTLSSSSWGNFIHPLLHSQKKSFRYQPYHLHGWGIPSLISYTLRKNHSDISPIIFMVGQFHPSSPITLRKKSFRYQPYHLHGWGNSITHLLHSQKYIIQISAISSSWWGNFIYHVLHSQKYNSIPHIQYSIHSQNKSLLAILSS